LFVLFAGSRLARSGLATIYNLSGEPAIAPAKLRLEMSAHRHAMGCRELSCTTRANDEIVVSCVWSPEFALVNPRVASVRVEATWRLAVAIQLEGLGEWSHSVVALSGRTQWLHAQFILSPDERAILTVFRSPPKSY
jgi:hypothetical protein